MKRCPECRRDYSDETLNFCLDDGAALVEGPASEFRANEPVTAVLPTVAIPSERPTLRNVERSRVPWPKWIVVAVLALAIFGGTAYWFVGRRMSVHTPPPQPKLTQITFADGVE